tara:strand:- start:4808 stop:5023 length:216 start_codon:yes stop_codon:yes gene_type:complete
MNDFIMQLCCTVQMLNMKNEYSVEFKLNKDFVCVSVIGDVEYRKKVKMIGNTDQKILAMTDRLIRIINHGE